MTTAPRPVISVAAAAEILDVHPKTARAYLQAAQMPRLDGYAQPTLGAARRTHAHKVYADSVTTLQRWLESQDPLRRARKGLPHAS